MVSGVRLAEYVMRPVPNLRGFRGRERALGNALTRTGERIAGMRLVFDREASAGQCELALRHLLAALVAEFGHGTLPKNRTGDHGLLALTGLGGNQGCEFVLGMQDPELAALLLDDSGSLLGDPLEKGKIEPGRVL